jgi:tetratricopeptide (TPR) repeat protein
MRQKSLWVIAIGGCTVLLAAAYISPDHLGFNSLLSAQAYRRGVALDEKHDLANAISEYSLAIARDPNMAEAFNARAVARRRTGDFDGAVADLNEVIRLRPNDSAGYFNRAVTYQLAWNDDAALRDFDESITRASAFLKELERQRGAKLDYVRRTIEIEARARLIDARLAHGKLAAQSGDHSRALKDFEEAAASTNTLGRTSGKLEHARVRVLQRDYETAKSEIEGFLAAEPDNAGGLMLRGFMLLFHDRLPGAAAEDFEKALNLGFKYQETRGMMAAADPGLFGTSSWLAYGVLFRPDIYYLVAWQHVARRRSGQETELDLDANLRRLATALGGADMLTGAVSAKKLRESLVEWPGPVLQVFSGQMSEEQLLSAAGNAPNEIVRQRRVCDARFYGALYKPLSPPDLHAAMQDTVRACPQGALEAVAAELEHDAP